jgi:hypothetical protein
MYFPRFRDSFASDMDRRTNLRGIAFCLALLPLSCAQQLSDGSNDAQAPVDLGAAGSDLGDPDAKVAPQDTGASGVDDTPRVDPPDAGAADDVPVGPDDAPTAAADAGSAVDVGFDVGVTPVDAGGPVDVGVDTGPVDTGPRCTAPLSDCGAGACVNTQNSAAHCGGCGRTCATGQSCVAGACTLVCAAPTVICGGACVNTQTDATHCGSCPRACATGARCLAGTCVGGVIPGASFQVALSASNCNTVDHEAVTGDDRGGIAVSNERVFYSGDTSTGRFDLQSLVGESVGRIYDALASNLATGALYTLAIGSAPLTNLGGTVTTLMELNPATGGLTSGLVNLSQPIPLPATGSVGIFSGYERIVLLGGGRAWHISLPSGAVIDLGPVALPTARVACENWAIWGVAEFFGGALYVDFVQSPTVIARMRVPEGTVAPLATFTALSDMCSFTVSPLWRRWYFHHELTSQFRAGAAEVVGYCDATITGPTLGCRPIDTTCAGSCVNLQSSATNCGACGRACAAGESCVAGVCGIACPAGQSLCGGACVDVTSDSNHCGTCGRTCIGGQWCIAGACGGGAHYSVDAAPAGITYVDACSAPGAQRILMTVDDQAVVAPLPFATRWWGAPLTAGTPMAVTSNGVIQINGSAGFFTTSGSIPSVFAPNSVIAPQWADQVTTSSGVCVATLGTAPARRWVSQWVGTHYYADTNSLNYEVIVHEGSGVIEFAYAAMSGSQPATIGLESPDGTQAVGPCPSGNNCTAVSNYRARFTPIP